MASVNLKLAYIHLASDPGTYVSFRESTISDNRGTRSEVQTYSDETRKVVSSPADEQGLSITLPLTERSTVESLRAMLDKVVLFRSPTGQYEYAQFLSLRTRRQPQTSDLLVDRTTLGLEPVTYPGLI